MFISHYDPGKLGGQFGRFGDHPDAGFRPLCTRDHTTKVSIANADRVSGILLSVTNPTRGFEIYNLGAGRTTKLSDMIAMLEEHCGKKANIVAQADQPGDVPRTFADVSKAVTNLRYLPRTELRTGIAKFVSWLKTEPT